LFNHILINFNQVPKSSVWVFFLNHIVIVVVLVQQRFVVKVLVLQTSLLVFLSHSRYFGIGCCERCFQLFDTLF